MAKKNCPHLHEYKAEPVIARDGRITGWVYRCFVCNAVLRKT